MLKLPRTSKPNAVLLDLPATRQIKKLSGRLRWKTNRLTSHAKPTIIMLDGKHIIKAVMDLQDNKLLSRRPIKDAHGMVLLDDFASVQNIINNGEEFAAAVKKREVLLMRRK